MEKEDIYVIGKIENKIGEKIYIRYQAVSGSKARWVSNERISFSEDTEGGTLFCITNGNDLFKDNFEPLSPTDSSVIALINKLENGEELVSDDVPNFEHDEEAPAIDVVIEDEDDGVKKYVSSSVVWGGSLLSGMRITEVVDWKFTPNYRPAFALLNTEEMSAMKQVTSAPVNNKKGKPCAWMVFNPDLASDMRPLGAYLGTHSPQYYPLPYYVGFDPFIERAKLEEWVWSAIAFEEGKKARCDVQINDLNSVYDKDISNPMSGVISKEVWESILEKITNDYVFGFTVFNSLDGSSTLKVQATAQRKKNKALLTLSTTRKLLKLMHKKGVMQDFEWDKLGKDIKNVVRSGIRELAIVEMSKQVKITPEDFEKIMTICEKEGIITWPNVKKDDDDEVLAVSRGHMWRVLGAGWTYPTEDWVSVDNEHKCTLFHVYNILSGSLTHKPTWSDGKKNGQTLNGNAVGFNTLNSRLQKAHAMMAKLTLEAYQDYQKDVNNGEVVSISDGNDMKDCGLDMPSLNTWKGKHISPASQILGL